MTKGLRCPNCDTTVHRKTVHDWIVNKTAPYLQCPNQFCNVQWRRGVLEKNAHLFNGAKPARAEPAKKTPVTEVKAPVSTPVYATKVAKAPTKARTDRERWLERVRKVARGHAKTKGVVSIDVIRRWADENNELPDSPSAWGSVFQTDEWERVGKMNSTYKSNRSRQVTVWKLKSPMAVAAAG